MARRSAPFLFLLAGISALAADGGLNPATIAHPPAGSWLTYNGDYSGKRFSSLDQINESCRPRDHSAKGAKAAWWAEREELDDRLKDFLATIEHVWLGGFRGIFSQHTRRADLLARFQKTFQTILDKHLPSRQQVRRGRRKAAASTAPSALAKVTLDPRVLELFIGLGDATAADCDFDDALNDLLYFVVDILQFHGERNGENSPRIEALDRELQGAGFKARASLTIMHDMWMKWVLLATLGAATCLMRGSVGEIEAAPDGADFSLRCLHECAAVAAARRRGSVRNAFIRSRAVTLPTWRIPSPNSNLAASGERLASIAANSASTDFACQPSRPTSSSRWSFSR